MLPNLYNCDSIFICLAVPLIIIALFIEVTSLDSCIQIRGFLTLTPVFPPIITSFDQAHPAVCSSSPLSNWSY